ncbi:MAG: GTPase Era [Coprothermobacter proteolyticus]|uniref:GTPase Era n=1 Tax=Coprothermobacter proteolyticus (strain ATCC 35245 / DSM 5265 / OCM 4 / BT) TaxID=309798 RepID=B5Y7V1_COPPD|nr:GTPase Era [Coprothermobacter proteolyticus]ACI17426.1 GTP-binding protein Era [Coprothermobacter proteolyticus DSM 5265]
MSTLSKSGIVSLVGRPSVGKSTLINNLVKQKVSIVTPRAQTTRRPIRAILNTEDGSQIVFVDLPGAKKPYDALGEYLLDSVWRNVGDSDLALFVVDGSSVPPGPGDIFVARNLMKTGVPALLVMNKSDLICDDQVEERLRMFESLGDFVGSVAISALNGSNLDRLVNLVLDHLDEGPQFYPEGMQTDQPLEQFIGEIIREKIMLLTSDEIPYAVESQVDFLDEQEDIIRINATIYVERESQKPIIIGANGQMIKQIGTLARKELEVVLGKHVFLGLWVKVKENWRNNKEALYYFGYHVE